jgi:hypothetical protein
VKLQETGMKRSLKSNHIVGLVAIKMAKYGLYIIMRDSAVLTHDMSIRHFDNLVQSTGVAVDQINHILVDDSILYGLPLQAKD